MSQAVCRDSAATSLTDVFCGLPRPFLQAYWLPGTPHIIAALKAIRSQSVDGCAVTFDFVWTIFSY